jgi:AAA domain
LAKPSAIPFPTDAGLEKQAIKSAGPLGGSGLHYLPVAHSGNQNCSPEEAPAIAALVNTIMDSGSTWIDGDGQEKAITFEDVVIITPYNAQMFEIQQQLPNARVGTVDKFQGQQAAIAIYSMATSSHADAPRGMEFLYSLNRLNVATSRAKCISHCRFPTNCRSRMPDAPANTISQRILPVLGNGNAHAVGKHSMMPTLQRWH